MKKLIIMAMFAAGAMLSKPAFAMEYFIANNQNQAPSSRTSTEISTTVEDNLKDFSKTIIDLIKICDKMIDSLKITKEKSIEFNEISSKILEIINQERPPKTPAEKLFMKNAYEHNLGFENISSSQNPTPEDSYKSRLFLIDLYKKAHKICNSSEELINNPIYHETTFLIKEIQRLKTAIISENQELISKKSNSENSDIFNNFKEKAINKVKEFFIKKIKIISKTNLDTCCRLLNLMNFDKDDTQINVIIKLLETEYKSDLNYICKLIESAKNLLDANPLTQYLNHKSKLEEYYKETLSRFFQILSNLCSFKPKNDNEKKQTIDSCTQIIENMLSKLGQLDIDLANFLFSADDLIEKIQC